MRSINLRNSTFLILKIILGTLIDVGNAKHQNITSKNRRQIGARDYCLKSENTKSSYVDKNVWKWLDYEGW